MDASNPAEFDTKMESLSEEWKKRHPQGERFLTYLTKYKAEEIKKIGTQCVRVSRQNSFSARTCYLR